MQRFDEGQIDAVRAMQSEQYQKQKQQLKSDYHQFLGLLDPLFRDPYGFRLNYHYHGDIKAINEHFSLFRKKHHKFLGTQDNNNLDRCQQDLNELGSVEGKKYEELVASFLKNFGLLEEELFKAKSEREQAQQMEAYTAYLLEITHRISEILDDDERDEEDLEINRRIRDITNPVVHGAALSKEGVAEFERSIREAFSLFSTSKEVQKLLDFLEEHPEIEHLDLTERLMSIVKLEFFKENFDSLGVITSFGYVAGKLPLWASVPLAIIFSPVFIPLLIFDVSLSLLKIAFSGIATKEGVSESISNRLADLIKHNKTLKKIDIGESYLSNCSSVAKEKIKSAAISNETLQSIDIYNVDVQKNMKKNLTMSKTNNFMALKFFNVGKHQGQTELSKLPNELMDNINTRVLESSIPKNAASMFNVPNISKNMIDYADKRYSEPSIG